MKIYCIYDKKGQVYLPPFMVVNDEVNAVRNVIMAVNSPNNNLSTWPEDFCLNLVGEFDDHTGRIVQKDVLPVICECLALVRPQLNGNINEVNDSMKEAVRPAAQERQS